MFIDQINQIVKDKDYSCKRILKLCYPMMEDLSSGLEPHNWLEYIYNFTLNKSFPNAVQMDLDPKYDKASHVYLEFFEGFFRVSKS